MTMLDPNFDPFAGLDVDANPGAYFVMPTLWADMDAWHERVAQLRKETPIVPVDIPNFKKFWVLTRHKDIFEIERQPELWPNTRLAGATTIASARRARRI